MGEDSEEFNKEELTKLLKDVLYERLSSDKKRKMIKQDNVPTKVQINAAMISTLTEFLNCFMLIGYDLNGEPVVMTIYNNKMEKSALDNAFMEMVSKYMGGK